MLILLDVSDALEGLLRLGSGSAEGTSLGTAMWEGCVSLSRSRKSSAQTQGEASVQKPQPPSTERWPPYGSRDGDRSDALEAEVDAVALVEGAYGDGGSCGSEAHRSGLVPLREVVCCGPGSG